MPRRILQIDGAALSVSVESPFDTERKPQDAIATAPLDVCSAHQRGDGQRAARLGHRDAVVAVADRVGVADPHH